MKDKRDVGNPAKCNLVGRVSSRAGGKSKHGSSVASPHLMKCSRLPHGHFVLQFLPAVAENQPANKNRMTTGLSNFAARLRERILLFTDAAAEVMRLALQDRKSEIGNRKLLEPPYVGCYENEFNTLALELFALQFKTNAAYRKICVARNLTPEVVEHWTQIPAVPPAAFKELELTCLAPAESTTVFHSSGTTEQRPSRHYHSPESLAVYEASLWPWFRSHLFADKLKLELQPSATPAGVQASACGCGDEDFGLVILTPPPVQAPHSSLVHMFETIRQKLGGASVPASRTFFGDIAADDGSWTLNFDATLAALNSSLVIPHPSLLLGTAFSFVHLLDYLEEKDLHFDLPAGSRVMETGGYKNRSRSLTKTELHQLITERLGVPPSRIICEYGMSELSSQAYDTELERRSPARCDAVGVQALACSDGTLTQASPRRECELQHAGSETGAPPDVRHFHFPPWAQAQIISPETGREVADGETGLIRVFDLANVFSVMAVQTEDLGIRRGDGFELIGRAALVEARGCSLMTI